MSSSDGRFSGRIAIVTGAAAGIGRATATLLAAEGATVAVADVDGDAGRATAERVSGATFVEVDVRDEASVESAFATVDRELGPVGVLVHCAGGSSADDAPVDELSVDVFDATVALDLRGAVLCSKAAITRMRRNGGGAIVHIVSYHALGGDAPAHAYVAAKGAVVSLTRAMAARYATDAIRVNAVAPGIVLTDRVRKRIANDGVDLEPIRSSHPGAIGEPEDIARIACFLASDESLMITGATIPADGGLTAF